MDNWTKNLEIFVNNAKTKKELRALKTIISAREKEIDKLLKMNEVN